MKDDRKYGRYILIGQTPVPCEKLLEWGAWMEDADRRVFASVVDGYDVSTVFLGLDHNHAHPGNPPILFETMIFLRASRLIERIPGETLIEWGRRSHEITDELGDQRLVDWQRRYSTWSEAEAGHESAVRLAEGILGVKRTPPRNPTDDPIRDEIEADIYVRVEVNGKWQTKALSELPEDIRRREIERMGKPHSD